MNNDYWKSQIVLNEGDVLKHDGSRTTGFMEEEDIDTYSVVRADGTKTGSVIVTDHTAVRGFRRTIRFIQSDLAGKVLAESSYTVTRD